MKGVSMLILKAKLLSIYKSMDYVNKETGETTLGKVKLQLMTEVKLKNGETKHSLIDVSIPTEKLSLFKDKIGQVVSVEVNLIAKQYTFYGV